ncbi:MAG: hypothetical protein NUW24_11575 [Anaerolineae bacterium]|jgi:hypothetical protein|nr:hypothetical protein [Anaerolineae bacterium]
MNAVRLHSIHPAANRYRFYIVLWMDADLVGLMGGCAPPGPDRL